MEFIYEMTVVLEVIFMNLCIFKKNAVRIYTTFFTRSVLLIYTLLLITIGIVLIRFLGIYGNGNGVFTLMGFFYLLPLHYLFEGSIRRHFYIICFAWIYTLSIFTISIQMGYWMKEPLSLACCVMMIQPVLFAITYYFVNKFMNHIYMDLMKCNIETIQKNLNTLSLLWFVCIFFLNTHFIFNESRLLKIIAVLVLIMNAFYSFLLLHEILMKQNQLGSLKTETAKDTLTGLGSRLAFDHFIENCILKGDPFIFFYLDLDEFKLVNDTYGHLTGDIYLKEFSSRLQDIKKLVAIFRISGDEFVIIAKLQDEEYILKQLQKLDFMLPATKTLFRGVSYGISYFPNDGQTIDELMYHADQKMYMMKTSKKTYRV